MKFRPQKSREPAEAAHGTRKSTAPRAVRIRTLLVLVAIVVTAALGTQVAITAMRLLDQADKIRDDSVTGNKAGLPSYMVLDQLQAERRLTAARLGGGQVAQQDLEKQRAATDKAEADFQRLSGPELPESDRYVYDYIVMVKDKLVGLQEQRRLADSRTGDPQKILDFYTTAIDQAIRLYQEMSDMDDGHLTYETRQLVALMHATEALSREDAMIALAGPNRVLTDAQYSEFARSVGVQRFLYGTSIAPYIPPKDKAIYDAMVASPAWVAQTRIEDTVIAKHKAAPNGGVVLPAEIDQWQTTRDQVHGPSTGLNVSRVQGLLDHSFGKAADLRHSAWWLAGASAAAVLLIVLLVLLTIRTVLRRTNTLRRQALDLAENRLPDMVGALQRGEEVDTSVLPRPTGAKDEIGQIGDAVATLAQQASDGAKLVYRERQGFERFAEGVTGRAVVLIGVQLHQLEVLMREHDRDPELIGKLYGLDHQTVRLRRQIENLQVLSGGAISNPHEDPAPIANLLAELIENGARYSPPDFKVVVRAQQAVHGLTVEIEDRGVGLTPAQYEALNARLARVPLYAEMADNAAQLGLFVVGRLAAQIGLEVTLRRSVYGGTAAIVLIPRSLLVNTADGPAAPPASEMVQHERPETAGGLPVRPLAPRPAAAAAPDPAPVADNPFAPVAPVAPVVPAPAAPAPAAPAGPRHAAVPEQRPTTPVADAATYRPAEDTGLAPLPRRARGTHLATQLRDETGEVEQAAFAADSPEAARDMYRGLQAAFDQAEQPDRIDNADSAEDTPAPR
jgi:hypothetical protein